MSSAPQQIHAPRKQSQNLNISPQKHQINAQVLEMFQQLNKQIQSLDMKVQLLMDQHQGQFVLAYQNHVRKIKVDLQALKKRADQQEKQLRDNNRNVMLEKQAIVFRDQSLKLYERLQAKTQQAQFYKYRAKDLQKTASIMQREIRQTLKSRKLLQTRLSFAQNRLKSLQTELSQKKDQIKQLNETLTTRYAQVSKQNDETIDFHLQSQLRSKQTTKMRSTRMQFKKRSMSYVGLNQDQQLKQWFLECVKAIKKEIAARKVGKERGSGLEAIRNIEEFKMVDKLKLLEKFVENQKLLAWMYEKIFPSRTNQLKEYLSHRAMQTSQLHPLEPTQESMLLQNQKQVNKTSKQPQRIQIALPKMQTPKARSNSISNRVSLHSGKLKIISQ